MPKVTYVDHQGETTALEVPVGWSVMEGAVQNDLDGIVAECGGGCACATCHVFIDDAWFDKLDERSDMESDMLECTAVERRATSRLACQVKVTEQLDGLIVHMPETQT